MYHYPTGAASWLVLTVITQMFGVKGVEGNLHLEPQLLKEQFDKEGNAWVQIHFAGRRWKVIYENRNHKEIGDYEVEEIYINAKRIAHQSTRIEQHLLKKYPQDQEHTIRVVL